VTGVRAFACAIAAAVALGGCTREPAADREQAVRAAFSAYKLAAMTGDGGTAASLLSSMTVNHFGYMRDLALYGLPEEVMSHPCVNQLSIFRFRQFVPADVLKSFSAEQALAYALSQGWIGRDVVAHVELGRVEMHGSGALGEVLVDGVDNEFWHILLEEDGRWRLDLLQGYGVAESEFGAIARQHGVGPTEVALVVLKRSAGIEIDPDRLLQPLVPAAASAPPAGG
jgi:hypothetical protein